jgi:tetratricopeptide (TPR) repeat protein
LEELRRLDSNYQRQEVEGLLFDAYSQRAVTLMEAGELEEALAHVDGALEIRPADQSVSDQRLWLSTYLTGLTQWGIDWVRVVGTFRELYDSNPDFLDVDQRLHDAYLNVGDQYHEEGAWCVAEQQYSAASQILATQASTAKLEDARELCAQAIAAATPSVNPTEAPTQPITPTATVALSEAVRGYIGEFLGYVEVDATEMVISVHVLSAQGEDVAGTEVQISAYDWLGEPKMTDAQGHCEFAGLTQELEFTVTLTDLPSTPFLVHARWGTEAQVSFVEG